jgi:hypothetical protein
MLKSFAIRIEGRSPLLMHRGGLADPMDRYAALMKEITGKRKKTEADHAELARIEWYGSMYADKQGRPCIPGEVIEGMLGMAGAKFRLKQVVRSSLFSDGDWPLEFPDSKAIERLEASSGGNPALDWLWESGKYKDSRLESVNAGKVLRTRPRFDQWALNFEVEVDTDQLSKDQLAQILETAGRLVSLGDRRPKFGRFEVVSLKAA